MNAVMGINARPGRASLGGRLRRAAAGFFAGVGILALGLFALGLAADIQDADRTQGGYEPPYTGWTGTPINFAAWYATGEGLYKRGYVFDTRLNCATGMITARVLNVIPVDFRRVSERAIAVHKPREACLARGFRPEF